MSRIERLRFHDLQTALAVVAQCETELLQLDDFEDLITHLKVQLTFGTSHSPQLLHTSCTLQLVPRRHSRCVCALHAP